MPATTTINLATTRTMEFVDITAAIQQGVRGTGVADGLCAVYNPHTTAGLTINEGADPAVQADILAALPLIVPMRHAFTHMEGNSPAHIMAALMGSSVSVLVADGRLRLGTWQKIFFCEFDGPRSRQVLWKLLAG
jgi:secondary thiamine-phosphate synthase enzyme